MERWVYFKELVHMTHRLEIPKSAGQTSMLDQGRMLLQFPKGRLPVGKILLPGQKGPCLPTFNSLHETHALWEDTWLYPKPTKVNVSSLQSCAQMNTRHRAQMNTQHRWLKNWTRQSSPSGHIKLPITEMKKHDQELKPA